MFEKLFGGPKEEVKEESLTDSEVVENTVDLEAVEDQEVNEDSISTPEDEGVEEEELSETEEEEIEQFIEAAEDGELSPDDLSVISALENPKIKRRPKLALLAAAAILILPNVAQAGSNKSSDRRMIRIATDAAVNIFSNKSKAAGYEQRSSEKESVISDLLNRRADLLRELGRNDRSAFRQSLIQQQNYIRMYVEPSQQGAMLSDLKNMVNTANKEYAETIRMLREAGSRDPSRDMRTAAQNTKREITALDRKVGSLKRGVQNDQRASDNYKRDSERRRNNAFRGIFNEAVRR
jgi:hypothetical protein